MNKITKTYLIMDTIVSFTVVSEKEESYITEKINHSFQHFQSVEEICSRFNPNSELSRLSKTVLKPVKVSEILFQTIRFGLEVSELTNGIFDITLGKILEDCGFNKEYLTGNFVKTDEIPSLNVSYKDIQINEKEKEITLLKPLLLDLGAIAKGFAVDLAVQELEGFEGFCINAGGDIFVSGLNEQKELWTIGIQHPFHKNKVIHTFQSTDIAVCTSGSYERISPKKENTHHLIDPKTRKSSSELVSCTVIAPFAMLADSLSTSAFILGHKKGLKLLEENHLDGIFINSSLDIFKTRSLIFHE